MQFNISEISLLNEAFTSQKKTRLKTAYISSYAVVERNTREKPMGILKGYTPRKDLKTGMADHI